MKQNLSEILEIAQQNFRQLQHAAVDRSFEFVKARNKSTGEDVVLVCIVNRRTVPPAFIGAPVRVAHEFLPVCEFIVLDDFTERYEVISESIETYRTPPPLPAGVIDFDRVRRGRATTDPALPRPPDAA